MSPPFLKTYAGRRVFITGHTGFKGSWLSLWLHTLGAEVVGFSLPPATPPNLHETLGGKVFADEIFGDIREMQAVNAAVAAARPDFVFHLAAQPLVRLSFAQPVETFEVNVMGTVHLLEALRTAGQRCPVIIVTSDKCYENRGWEWGYREHDPLGGHDVYSMSKAATELVAQSWRRSFFQTDARLGPLATVRAGNVIGGGDYAADRIVPDCVRALLAGRPIGLRSPHATRPWQHVLDCLSGYLWLGAKLAGPTPEARLADAFNFGPDARSNQPVAALVHEFLQHWPGEWRDESRADAPHEASFLHLSTDRAAQWLGWYPTWDFATAVRETARWYHARHVTGADMAAFSRAQIAAFTAAAAARGLTWAKPS
ncbi:MAG: CDP-glucose 4,6-dehydratase [Proteobacteria bacterium]|nr:CDP-glucose 4,6-dehydratase [Verrucomicrobiota bacterium]NBU09731.1 CDP-glucose 4,6-dehydratase [Pseudomonadota bacterium]